MIIRVLGDGRIALSRGMGCLTSYGRVPPCYRMLGCNIARGSRHRAGVAISRASCDISHFLCYHPLALRFGCDIANFRDIAAGSRYRQQLPEDRNAMESAKWPRGEEDMLVYAMLRWATASKPQTRGASVSGSRVKWANTNRSDLDRRSVMRTDGAGPGGRGRGRLRVSEFRGRSTSLVARAPSHRRSGLRAHIV